MDKNILSRLLSLSLQFRWDNIENILKTHKQGPSLLVETAYGHLTNKTKDIVAVQAAIVLFQVSAIIVDDIVDEDTKGVYLDVGPGRAANLAVTFCNNSYRLILESELSESDKMQSMEIIREVYDRQTDAVELESIGSNSEGTYWDVVLGKSGQVCGNSLRMGAILAGADKEMVASLFTMGQMIGEIGQVCNDFAGAFKKPANVDWLRSGSNLLLIAAMNKRNPEQKEFIKQSKNVFDKDISILNAAQQMLIDCGAVSYASSAITSRLIKMTEIALSIKNEGNAGLASFFHGEIAQAMRWLQKRKLSIPGDLSNAFKLLA
jgi:geranylgeranyl pyrophosphate synthase